MNNVTPQIGSWYKDLQGGSIFEVVAIDDSVEAQMVDGEICEYDMDSWDELLLESIEEPEDWRNPFELSGDDYHDSSDYVLADDWNNPVSHIEPEYTNGLTDDF